MKRLLVLLALALPLASCARSPDYARDVRDAPPPPRVYFDGEPTFVLVPGTQTYWYDNTAGALDLYRFGDAYYLWSSDTWYRGPDYDGPFRVLYRASVPADVFTAAEYRQRYGDDRLRSRRWDGDDWRTDRGAQRGPAAINVSFQTRPRFARVGEDVFHATNTPASYDLFRHRGDYYVYRNGWWYRNDAMTGRYERLARRSVPSAVVTAASRVMGRDWRRNVGN